MSKQLKKREEVAQEQKWDLEDIFATDEKWEEAFTKVKESLPQLANGEGTLSKSADHLFAALEKQSEIFEQFEKLYTYAHMRYDEDTTNSFYQGLNGRAQQLGAEIGQASSYLVPELLAMEEELVNQYVEEHDGLTLYKQMLAQLNEQRAHVLSAAEESILAQASDVINSSSNTFGMLNNADLEFPVIKDENGEDIQVTHGRFIRFLESKDRRVREDAFKAVYRTYKHYINTFASTLNGQVKRDLFLANVRHYQSAREAALHANHIPEIVYDQLVNTVNKHLHLLHRYVSLRKKILKVDELHMYDLYVPLIENVEMEVTYEEAKQYLLDGVKPLGEEYQQIVQEGFDQRWVDVEENIGKRSGAYSSGAYGTMPYILMNWQDDVNSLFTLAHEFGHSVHSYYTRKSQPYIYGDYTIFVAEVASTVNEALLNDHLIDKAQSTEEKLFLLNHFLEGFRGTVFRQTMFAEFEQQIHEKSAAGEPLTPDVLTALYYDLNKKYYGTDIIIDEEIGLEWARIPHFYYNFYVYQYATGYSAAAALAKQIQDGQNGAVEKYIEFLKAGSSDYPIEVLKKAGVDMTSAQPIEQALALFEQVLTEMESLIETID